jgi:hypothetical protein
MGFRVSVSLHPAIQATGRLTFAPAGLIPAEHTSLPWRTNEPNLGARFTLGRTNFCAPWPKNSKWIGCEQLWSAT